MYNEVDNVRPLCRAIRAALDGEALTYELLLVDDGSGDDTPLRLTEEQRSDPRVRALTLRRNAGQTLAMAAGFAHARGRVIVSMDGDLQNDPRDIPLLLSRIDEGCDVVCGWRKDRKDAFLSRTLPSRIANRMIAWLTGVPIHDNGCSLKAYRASIIKNVALYGEMHRFIPAMSTLKGARIAEIVVNHHARRFGQSKYGLGRVWRVALDMLLIKMIIGFASRPAVGFGIMGLPFLLLGAATLVISISLFLGEYANGWIVGATTAPTPALSIARRETRLPISIRFINSSPMAAPFVCR